jgi:hypothetical protein
MSLAGLVDPQSDSQLAEAVERLRRQRVMHSKAP